MDRDGRILLRKGGGRRLLLYCALGMHLRLTGHQLCQPKDALSSGRLGKLFAWYSEAICVEHGRVEYRGNCSERLLCAYPSEIS